MKTLIIAAMLTALTTIPAAADSEWMGSFFGVYPNGQTSGTFNAVRKGEKLTVHIVTISPLTGYAGTTLHGTMKDRGGNKIVGSIPEVGRYFGLKKGGEMVGVFRDGGRFEATRQSKGSKSGKSRK